MGVISYKCPNCGGELTFEPASRKYVCPYCGSSFSQEQFDASAPREGQEQKTRGDTDAAGEAVVYSCPSCGAEIVTDATSAATFCYYCHNPVILTGRVSGAFAPDEIIPFKYNRSQAQDAFRAYVKGKKFVPRAFSDESQIDKLSGVYYPFWVYDCDVSADYHAEGTKLRVWVAGDTEFTETSIYAVDRAGDVTVKNLTKNALKKADHELVDNVQPFNLDEAEPFKMGYLSGFLAQRRDIEKEHFTVEAERETLGYAQNAIRGTLAGYTAVHDRGSHFQTKSRKWRYVLLPVWVLTYRTGNGKLYYFTMNGQSGRIAGKLPVDKIKLTLTSLLLCAAVMALALLGGYLI